ELINYLRKILLVKISGASEKYFFDIEKDIEEKIIIQAGKLDLKIWHGILKEFYDVFEYLDNDGFKQLPLEMAIISIKNKFFNENNNQGSEDPPPAIKNDSLAAPRDSGQANLKKEDRDSVKKNSLSALPTMPIGRQAEQAGKSDEVLTKSDDKSLKKEKIKEISNKDINVSVEDVIKIWPQLLINLKDYNHSLSAFVKVGHPLQIKRNRLILGFKFQFHLDRILQDEAKRTVEDILKSLLNAQLIIGCELDDNYEKNHEKMVSSLYQEKGENDNVISNLIQNFGGEVVN
ncbi:MAG: hypothetical protein U9R00_02125, partial [Patescibacteria group bacterium]|nr:hypothetical protein [Patescibacteria group bacterium]